MAKKSTHPKHSPRVSSAVAKKETSLSLADPGQVMEFGKVLKEYIAKNDLAVKIEDKLYAKVDAWKFAGFNFGLTGIPHRPEPQHDGKRMILILYIKEQREGKNGKPYMKEVPGFVGFSDSITEIDNYRMTHQGKITRELYRPYFAYKCECDIIKLSDRSIVSYGEGMCSNMEEGKLVSAEFAINSHSQTRAISRAFRNLLGFVMTSAGMQTTPFEEMEEAAREKAMDSNETYMGEDEFNLSVENVRSGNWTSAFVVKNGSAMHPDQVKALEIIEQNRKSNDQNTNTES